MTTPPRARAHPIARPACRRCDSDFVVGDTVVPAPAGGYQHDDPDVCTAVLAERDRAAGSLAIPCRRCDGPILPVIVHRCPDGVIP